MPTVRLRRSGGCGALHQPPEGCIHHAGRGSQYGSNEFQELLSDRRFKVSPLMYMNMHGPGGE